MKLELGQLFDIALSLNKETAPALAKRWGCSRTAVNRVIHGKLTSSPIREQILSYIETTLSQKLNSDQLEKGMTEGEKLSQVLSQAGNSTCGSLISTTYKKDERKSSLKLSQAKRGKR